MDVKMATLLDNAAVYSSGRFDSLVQRPKVLTAIIAK